MPASANRAYFVGMDVSLMSEIKAMVEENGRLKYIYAEMSMRTGMLNPIDLVDHVIDKFRFAEAHEISGSTGSH